MNHSFVPDVFSKHTLVCFLPVGIKDRQKAANSVQNVLDAAILEKLAAAAQANGDAGEDHLKTDNFEGENFLEVCACQPFPGDCLYMIKTDCPNCYWP